jgi:ADP-heptose:LPS heptosyltransferase
MNRYLLFRTDRIGDFLLSAILIKSVKRSDKCSFITVVASKKNYSYIKNFSYVDEVILFQESYFSKIIFYLRFIFKKFYLIALLDGKKRSLYFALLTRSKFKFLFTYKGFYKVLFKIFFTKIFYDNDSDDKISEIKNLLNFLNFDLDEDDFNTIDKSIVSSRDFKIPKFDDYTLLHLDEKWILNDYIQSYKSIEPISEKSLINFIEQLISKTNNNVYISNGSLSNKFTDFFKISFLMTGKNTYEFKILNKRVIFFDNMSFLQLEKLILNSTLLITCHGAPTHVAASFNKTIVDIIDRSELDFFNKLTAHFRDYKFCLRTNFIDLSKNILISLDS